MDTKFHQLRPGTRFLWQGATYEKINPLLGRNLDDGSQRLIPRSSMVTTLDANTPPPQPTAPIGPDLDNVRRVFEDYHRSSLHWLEQQDGSMEKLRLAQEALTRSRQRVLAVLGEETED